MKNGYNSVIPVVEISKEERYFAVRMLNFVVNRIYPDVDQFAARLEVSELTSKQREVSSWGMEVYALK